MAHVAVDDCERIRPGLVAQPVNTATSAAYLVAAGWVWRRGARRRAIWAPLLAWIGLGSIAYHGPGTRPGKILHDSALIALALGVLGGGGLLPTVPNRRAAGVALLGTAALTLHATTRTGRRACNPDSALQGHGGWHVLSAAAIALWADGEGKR